MTPMDNEILTSELKGHRTLATVVFTDCVGFSARMSVDEEHTLDLIRRDLKLMKRLCEMFDGRVLKTTGDGLLLCFSSAVKAVECAIAIQQAIAEAATQRSTRDSLMHRIGIHLADMYITRTDVMGNGVNIAARLQTEADPGGICISQTVYDVAKHGLQIATKYLGPRELKNIREVVPAYKVLLNGEEEPAAPYGEIAQQLEQSQNLPRIKKLILYLCHHRWENNPSSLHDLNLELLLVDFLDQYQTIDQLKGAIEAVVRSLSKQAEYTQVANEILRAAASFYALEDPSSPSLLLGIDHSTHIVRRHQTEQTPELAACYQHIGQTLDTSPEALRLKKLLFYVCRRKWESQAANLQALSTVTLVQELHHQAADATQLVALIDRFVQTLNKKAEYLSIANLLMGCFVPLYPDLAASTQQLLGAPTYPPFVVGQVEPNANELAIAQALDQAPQALRLKKLLAYVCRSQWSSDSAQLATIPTGQLVAHLSRLTPQLHELQETFESATKTLSKPSEYEPLVGQLVAYFTPIYRPSAMDRQPKAEQAPAPIMAASTQNSPNHLDRRREIVQPTTKPDPLLDDKVKGQALSGESGDLLIAAKLNQTIPEIAQVAANPLPTAQPTTQPKSAVPNSQQASLFDIRLGILKYTNPLRAKILLFSALYSDFTFTYQDWLSLKQCELDSLLQDIVKASSSYTDLELKLYSAANRLPDPEDHVQTADTLAKYLRELYIHGSPLIAQTNAYSPFSSSLDEFEQATRDSVKTPTALEYTIQLSSASVALDHTKDAPSTNPLVGAKTTPGENTCLLPTVSLEPAQLSPRPQD
jgi:adenylate cyclase